MDERRRSTFAVTVAVVLVLALSGCLHTPAAEDVRDDFVEAVDDVDGYEYEGETEFDVDGGFGAPTQTTTVTTTASVDRENRELSAETESRRELGAQSESSNTSTYLVDGSVYERSASEFGDSGWLRYDGDADVDVTWRSRDEVGFYADILEDAEVSRADDESSDGSYAVDVELDREGRLDLLTGKFGDDTDFFSDIDVDEFEMTAWITKDEYRLDRVEAQVSMTAEQNTNESTSSPLDVQASFVDDFRGYGDVEEIELPEDARDAEPVR